MSQRWRAIGSVGLMLSAGAVGAELWLSPSARSPWLYAALAVLGSLLGAAWWPSWRVSVATAAPGASPLPSPLVAEVRAQEVARALIEALPAGALLVGPGMELLACHAALAEGLRLRGDARGDLRDAAPGTEAGQALLAAVGRCLKQGAAELELALEGAPRKATLRALPWGDGRAALLWLQAPEVAPEAVQALLTQNLTLQESNEELRNSQELLTDQNERLRVQDQSKSDLLANVSHDLRTPLVSIRGYSEMLMRGDLGPVTEQQRRGLATSLRNLDKLLGLVENLLDFERLRHGDAALTLEDLDLLQLSGDIVELFRPRAQERGVALSLRGAASAARELWVSGDRIKLHQVASNLVSNALKFTVEGGAVWVELRVASREEAGQVERQLEAAREASSRGPTTLEGARRGRWVMLRVADTGCGISREHLSRIFDRHYSAHPGQNQGLGLGLSIIDQIVHSHGGMIEVSSAEGEGSVFTVWLPIGHPEAAEAGAGRFLSGPLRATAPSGAILLVEDDPDALEMTRLLLEGEGFEVEAARGEREMLEALARSAPGLVLLDYTLEGSATGHELLARLKQEPGTRQVPVVMLTGRTDAAVRDACIAAGAAGFLPKPFGVQELLEVVRDHLGVRVGSPRG